LTLTARVALRGTRSKGMGWRRTASINSWSWMAVEMYWPRTSRCSVWLRKLVMDRTHAVQEDAEPRHCSGRSDGGLCWNTADEERGWPEGGQPLEKESAPLGDALNLQEKPSKS
jgi:hypothetical protein